MDHFTRRIIGFSVHPEVLTGADICVMFNKAISGKKLPKYLSSDNDPLFRFHRWQANLRVLDIEEIKSVPYAPTSHPFIERLIGTTRREFIDHILFFNAKDLIRKLNDYQSYYNSKRGHSSLARSTPTKKAEDKALGTISLNNYRWEKHARGLFDLPIAA